MHKFQNKSKKYITFGWKYDFQKIISVTLNKGIPRIWTQICASQDQWHILLSNDDIQPISYNTISQNISIAIMWWRLLVVMIHFKKHVFVKKSCTVRVVKSWRAGVGKTLHKKRLTEKLHTLHTGVARSKKAVVSIPLHEREINIDDIMNVLLQNTLHPGKIEPRIFHIDLSHEVIVSWLFNWYYWQCYYLYVNRDI